MGYLRISVFGFERATPFLAHSSSKTEVPNRNKLTDQFLLVLVLILSLFGLLKWSFFKLLIPLERLQGSIRRLLFIQDHVDRLRLVLELASEGLQDNGVLGAGLGGQDLLVLARELGSRVAAVELVLAQVM